MVVQGLRLGCLAVMALAIALASGGVALVKGSRTPADRARGTRPATAGVRQPFTKPDTQAFHSNLTGVRAGDQIRDIQIMRLTSDVY